MSAYTDYTQLTDKELEDMESDLTLSILEIRTQVDSASSRAAAEGVYADNSWFVRAKTALRHKGRQHQAVLQERARRRREEKEKRNAAIGKTYDGAFKVCARAILDGNTYFKIHCMAMDMAEQKESAP